MTKAAEAEIPAKKTKAGDKKKDKPKNDVAPLSRMTASERAKARAASIIAINEKFKNSTGIASAPLIKRVPRIPTGIFALDMALGGGWGRGRVNLAWGNQSSSKTTSMLRAIANAQKMDAVSNRFISTMTEAEKKKAQPMACALVDVEGAFDRDWAKSLDVDLDALVVSRPDTAEEAAEMVEAFLKSGFDFVGVDSLAAMIPADELEGAMDDQFMGLQARILGRMFRKVQSVINQVYKTDPDMAPTLFVCNQLRHKVGVVFGSPEVKPGGKAQDFFSSIEVKFSPGEIKYYDANEKTMPKNVKFNFNVLKNKISPPKIHGFYLMQLVDDEDLDLKAGEVDEIKSVMEWAERFGIYKNADGRGFVMYDEPYKTKREIFEKFYLDRQRFALLKADLIKKFMDKE